jgi:hypothetical protein
MPTLYPLVAQHGGGVCGLPQMCVCHIITGDKNRPVVKVLFPLHKSNFFFIFHKSEFSDSEKKSQTTKALNVEQKYWIFIICLKLAEEVFQTIRDTFWHFSDLPFRVTFFIFWSLIFRPNSPWTVKYIVKKVTLKA